MAESLQSLADRGIQIGPGGQQYSATGPRGQYQPVSSSSGSQIERQLPQGMTLQDAQRQADQAFSGIVAPMTLEEIRAREEQAKAVTKETATSIYDPQISREKQVGGAQVSTAEGVVGQRQGFNISTAEQAFVAGVQDKVTDRIKEVESVKASYIAQGNLAAADRADNQLQQLNEFNTQMTIAKANYALQIMAGNREEARLGLERDRFSLEQKAYDRDTEVQDMQIIMQREGLKLDAFKLASSLPIGQTFEVNGIEYRGMADMSGIDSKDISISTDDRGYETGVHKITGEILWRSEKPVGKTKTQAANVTINMNEAQKSGLEAAYAILENSKGGDGYYNTNEVAKQLQNYAITNPGKASQFLDAMKPRINPKDYPNLQAQQTQLSETEKALELINSIK